jgi:hypothetical protein
VFSVDHVDTARCNDDVVDVPLRTKSAAIMESEDANSLQSVQMVPQPLFTLTSDVESPDVLRFFRKAEDQASDARMILADALFAFPATTFGFASGG